MDVHRPQRSIGEAISFYQAIKDDLREAIESEDSALIVQLDGQVTDAFDEILGLEPVNSAEAVQLVEFLLDAMTGLRFGSTLPDLINEKILDIVASGFGGLPGAKR